MKATLLKEVDNYLFASTVQQLSKIYNEAVKLNKGTFSYGFFNRGLLSTGSHDLFIVIPSEETIDYLKPHLEYYAPIIKRRELIQCYLLQFMNQSERTSNVAWLIPDKLLNHLYTVMSEPTLVKSLNMPELVKVFRQKPEYEMLIAQEVFLTMGL